MGTGAEHPGALPLGEEEGGAWPPWVPFKWGFGFCAGTFASWPGTPLTEWWLPRRPGQGGISTGHPRRCSYVRSAFVDHFPKPFVSQARPRRNAMGCPGRGRNEGGSCGAGALGVRKATSRTEETE